MKYEAKKFTTYVNIENVGAGTVVALKDFNECGPNAFLVTNFDFNTSLKDDVLVVKLYNGSAKRLCWGTKVEIIEES